MELLDFDTYHIINVYELAKDADIAWENTNKDEHGFVYVKKLVDGRNQLRHPFSICDYFKVKYNLQRDGEFIWEKVEGIRSQVHMELDNLMTNGEYKLDWNSEDNNSFGIFFKKGKDYD